MIGCDSQQTVLIVFIWCYTRYFTNLFALFLLFLEAGGELDNVIEQVGVHAMSRSHLDARQVR